jgi:hypothetical protein
MQAMKDQMFYIELNEVTVRRQLKSMKLNLDLKMNTNGQRISYPLNLTDPFDISMGDTINSLVVTPGDLSFMTGMNGPLIIPNVTIKEYQLPA